MKYLRRFPQHTLQQEHYENLDLDTDKTFVHLCEDAPHLHYENCTSARGFQFITNVKWPIDQASLLKYLEENYPVDDSSTSLLNQTQRLEVIQSYNYFNIINEYNYGFDYLSNDFEPEVISIKGNYKLATKMFQPINENTIGFGLTAGAGESDILLPQVSSYGIRNSARRHIKRGPQKVPSKATTIIGKSNIIANDEELAYEYLGDFVDTPNIVVNIGNKRNQHSFDELSEHVDWHTWWLFLLFNEYVPVRLVDLCQKDNDPTNLYAIYMTYNYCVNTSDDSYYKGIATHNKFIYPELSDKSHTDFPLIFLVKHCTNATIEETEDQNGNIYKEVTFDEQNTTSRIFIPNIQLYHFDSEDLSTTKIYEYYVYVDEYYDSYDSTSIYQDNDPYTHINCIINDTEEILLDLNGPIYYDGNTLMQENNETYYMYYKLEDSSTAFLKSNYTNESSGINYFDIIYENKKYVVGYDYTNDEIIIEEGDNENRPTDDIFKRLINAYWYYWTPDYPYTYLYVEKNQSDNSIYFSFSHYVYTGGY